ncbi:MAG: hypothetical protein ACTJHU_09590 [Mycetocola sp.]
MTPNRLGPIEISDVHLRIGSRVGENTLITADGVAPHGEQSAPLIRWDQLSSASINVPTSRIPGTAVLGWLLLAAAGLVGDDGYADDGVLTLTHTDGSETELRITRHHLLGYPHTEVVAANLLLEMLVSDPASRSELADPAALVAQLKQLAVERGRR